MKKTISVAAYVLAFVFSGNVWAACTQSGAAWTSTADYNSVSQCVSNATAGQTINILNGTANWSNTLTIAKGVSLIGAGSANTIISGASPLINYAPSSSNWASNHKFRVSGISFDLKGSGQGIQLHCSCATTIQSRIRIDHNKFYNSTAAGAAIFNEDCRGVIDNNSFESMRYPLRVGFGATCGSEPGGATSWKSYGEYRAGQAGADSNGYSQTMYVEDNTFTGVSTTLTDGDRGGSYVIRYNTVSCAGDMYPLLDLHNWQATSSGSLWGARGGEVYGNQFNCNGYLISHRGGRATVFNNTMSGASPQINIYHNAPQGCPQGESPYNVLQKINNSYFFSNRKGVSGALITRNTGADDTCGDVVVEDSTFWMDKNTCTPNGCTNITSGIGCGANLPTQCKAGTGFWKTTQTASCTNLTGLVGADHTQDISGTLYQCNSSGAWVAYFTPYEYPHRLVTLDTGGNNGNTRPNVPGNLRVLP